MRVLRCASEALGVFWRELKKEKEKEEREIWKCDGCHKIIEFNPNQIYIGGYGPRQGWGVMRVFCSTYEVITFGKKREYKFCPECMKEKFNL